MVEGWRATGIEKIRVALEGRCTDELSVQGVLADLTEEP
jgi:hypothetical protein